MLEIQDNGVGMDVEGLKYWCTLGESKPNVVNRMEHSTKEPTPYCFLTSEISRYGVGSKKAIFNIGSRVTVKSKAKGTTVESEVTLDKNELEKSSTPWQQKIKVASSQHDKNTSFTKFLISNIKQGYLVDYNAKTLREQLAHIYHYYIFGPFGNINVKQEKYNYNKLCITVDGETIDHTSRDMETRVCFKQNFSLCVFFNSPLST